MNVIFGSAGHAKEIEIFIRTRNLNKIDFFVSLHSNVFLKGIPVISENDFFSSVVPSIGASEIKVYLAIGDANLRKKIVDKIGSITNVLFPNLIFSTNFGDFDSIVLGEGNILFPNAIFTVDIKIGDQNHFNLGSSVSHDCIISNYNTFSPGVRIAGNVSVGSNNFFGLNCAVIDNITIGNDIIIGAGAVVTKNLMISGTYVGIPAKKIK